MTDNHNYNTPAKGTTDWHTPLNNNFQNIDTDVEIRDADANKDNYSPKDGAKFLAEDTGDVYVGDGSSWNLVGRITTGGGSSGATLAAPGSVQSAIDNAESTGGKVILDSTKTYVQPSTPWRLKTGVTLDCNGATVVGSGTDNSTDIFEIEAGSQLHNPQVDLYDGGSGYDAANQWNANVFKCSTRFGAEAGRPKSAGFYFARNTTITNGHIDAVGNGGTGLMLQSALTSTEDAITHCQFEFDVGVPDIIDHDVGLGVCLHIDTSEDDGGSGGSYINSTEVYGRWRYPGDAGILQTGRSGSNYVQQVRNHFGVQMQMPTPSDIGNIYPNAWRIEDPTWSKENSFWGWVWDTNPWRDNNEIIWAIDSTYGQNQTEAYKQCKDNIMIHRGGIDSGIVSNSSPGTHRIKDYTLQSVTEIN